MRRIPIQYAKRIAGRSMFAGQATYFPIKVNSSGVIPPIFAGALLSFPATLATWIPFLGDVQRGLEGNLWLYDGAFVLLIIFFSYFYTALTFRPDDVADNISKQGGYIPGIRPGPPTAMYLDRVLSRLTLPGSLFLALVAVLPSLFISYGGFSQASAGALGGTTVLIAVGVALDTMRQMEAQLMMRQYEGFLR